MTSHPRRFVTYASSLTLLVGEQELVNSVLFLEMVREHLDGVDGIRTHYFDADMTYDEICERVHGAFRNEKGIFIFEKIHDARFCALALNLVDCGFIVWAGINAPDARAAESQFEYMFNSNKETDQSAKLSSDQMQCAQSVWERVRQSPAAFEAIELRRLNFARAA